MKFNILKANFFPIGNNQFAVEFKVVGVVTAPSAEDAMKKAKKSYVSPILEPVL